MIAPAIPVNEDQRLEELESYNILDTLPEEDYDAITKLASEICGTPISLITLVDKDRQWFKSKHGLRVDQTPREQAFCAHAILNPKEPLIVPNSYEDNRFIDNPLVTGDTKVEFYAGIPLVGQSGQALGSLCVIDNQPRDISPSQIESLQLLARQVVNLLQLRKTVSALEKTTQELEESLESLNDFAQIVAHDIKAPVRNMGLLAEAIEEDYGNLFDEEGKYHLKLLTDSAKDAGNYIDGVLRYSRASNSVSTIRDVVDLNVFFGGAVRGLQPLQFIKIEVQENLPQIRVSEIGLKQIVNNILTNAVKYSDKELGNIQINAIIKEKQCHITISDNGRGIPETVLDRIFNIFYMVDKEDARKKGSSGIGLSIVKKVVTKMNGEILVSSKLGEGSQFTIILPI